MTIEKQPQLWGLIPLWKKREMKPGTTFKQRFGGQQWSIGHEYHVLDKDNLIDRKVETGFAVDPEGDALRSPSAESSEQDILSKQQINDANIGLPLPFIPGIIRVVTWKPTEGKLHTRQKVRA